ncbi:UNVERIFIED_CONTAM: hypothetical protein GTU68_007813 [Idotea baltica]|nr:hypothetical protein [Idotea baltica]
MVQPITIQAVSIAVIAMVGISLIFIPNPWCSLLVGVAIVSIETGVVGYMSLWGVNLDQISMINLIMCIGFSVDFSAHISYAYLTAKVETSEERLKECLYSLGLPIVQGGLSTIVCIVTFVLAPSYVYVTFFKIVFLVVFFAIIHGLLLIPVLLSMFGTGNQNKKKLPKTAIKIPRVKLSPKEVTVQVERTEVTKSKREPRTRQSPPAKSERWGGQSAPAKGTIGPRPDPEGCSNRSFGKENDKSEAKDR